MSATDDAALSAWADAVLAAAIFAVDPSGTCGVCVRSLHGPVRDRWLALVADLLPPGTPLRRIPLNVTDGRLLGGLDLAATLHAGRPIAERGILADADGGAVVLAMAERLSPSTVARLAAALDSGEVAVERDGIAQRSRARVGVIALDEGMADDELPELRAAAARALSNAQPGHAVEVLGELSRDPVWFVRLRAVVAIGKLYDTAAVPHLINALTDSNRLVRMRAAEALVDFKSELPSIFSQVVKTRDRYGLHAFLAALENGDLRKRLDAELRQSAFSDGERDLLLAVLSTGKLVETQVAAKSQPIETATR